MSLDYCLNANHRPKSTGMCPAGGADGTCKSSCFETGHCLGVRRRLCTCDKERIQRVYGGKLRAIAGSGSGRLLAQCSPSTPLQFGNNNGIHGEHCVANGFIYVPLNSYSCHNRHHGGGARTPWMSENISPGQLQGLINYIANIAHVRIQTLSPASLQP